MAPSDWVEYEAWVAYGVERGWVSEPVCTTHDGLPATEDEQAEWEAGYDPCQVALRVWIGVERWR